MLHEGTEFEGGSPARHVLFLKQARDADAAAHLAHEASIHESLERMFAEIRLAAVFRSSLDTIRASTS